MIKEAVGVAKHYVYRMDWDTGFAPNTKYGICSLSGCKKNSIERWAEQGSWVIGIGGNNTGKSDKLIFAMEVEPLDHQMGEIPGQICGLVPKIVELPRNQHVATCLL